MRRVVVLWKLYRHIFIAMNSDFCLQTGAAGSGVDNTNRHTIEGEHFQDISLTDESTVRSVDRCPNHTQIGIDSAIFFFSPADLSMRVHRKQPPLLIPLRRQNVVSALRPYVLAAHIGYTDSLNLFALKANGGEMVILWLVIERIDCEQRDARIR